jgi:hypothetical protein
LQCRQKCRYAALSLRVPGGKVHKYADPARLVCSCDKRERDRYATKKRKKFTPSHRCPEGSRLVGQPSTSGSDRSVLAAQFKWPPMSPLGAQSRLGGASCKVQPCPQCSVSDGRPEKWRPVAMGLGCVKTCTREKDAELFSLSPSPDCGRQRFCF